MTNTVSREDNGDPACPVADKTAQEYTWETLQYIDFYVESGGSPDNWYIESWHDEPSAMGPESTANTAAWLTDQAMLKIKYQPVFTWEYENDSDGWSPLKNVNADWSGVLKRLRWDPVMSGSSGAFEVDYISVGYIEGR